MDSVDGSHSLGLIIAAITDCAIVLVLSVWLGYRNCSCLFKRRLLGWVAWVQDGLVAICHWVINQDWVVLRTLLLETLYLCRLLALLLTQQCSLAQRHEVGLEAHAVVPPELICYLWGLGLAVAIWFGGHSSQKGASKVIFAAVEPSWIVVGSHSLAIRSLQIMYKFPIWISIY